MKSETVNAAHNAAPNAVQPIGAAEIGAGTSARVIGVIYNPRSHRNQGQDLDVASLPNVFVAQPAERDEITVALEDFRDRGIDYLIINGGDGTVRDVLSCGYRVFGDNWPYLAVLPKGKTNALNVDLGAPAGWNLPDAIAAFANGKCVKRRPLMLAPGAQGQVLLGFIMGAGGFTLGVRAGQDAHRMGAFNSLAVGLASAWGVLQGLLGRDDNIWRRGVEMNILMGDNRDPAPRSQYGVPGRRAVMLSSTLMKFPAGIKLFGKLGEGLKMVVMDHPRRRSLALLPAVLAGWVPSWLPQSGIHFIAMDHYELEIGDELILDGEALPAGKYHVSSGPELSFVVP